jgi:hypothetical protein
VDLNDIWMSMTDRHVKKTTRVEILGPIRYARTSPAEHDTLTGEDRPGELQSETDQFHQTF